VYDANCSAKGRSSAANDHQVSNRPETLQEFIQTWQPFKAPKALSQQKLPILRLVAGSPGSADAKKALTFR
jgi:hypothetical protein